MLMIGKPLSAQQRLDKAVIEIMGNPRYVALSGIMMIGARTLSEKIPTACTNGRDETYGRAFVEKLSDSELRFLILHECYHKLYRHLTTWKWMHDINHALANMACDYVINLKIQDENKDGFATMPMRDGKPMGLIDERFRGMDSAEVFHILRDENEDEGGGGGSGEDEGEGAGEGGAGHDNNEGGLDSHDWDGAQSLSDEDKKALERDIDEAIRQGVLAAGKMGSGGARDLEELLQPKVDWREVLREFVCTTCAGNDFSTWRRPNRRFISSGVYMPSGVSEQVGELVIAIDTSGSIGGPELQRFLSEVASICETVKPNAVRLLYWDTTVCQDEKYSAEQVQDIVKSTKPAGGGGTDVACVNRYMSEHAIKPQAVVVLTDGYLGGDYGTWTVPVLWCVVGSTQTPPVGKTVFIKD